MVSPVKPTTSSCSSDVEDHARAHPFVGPEALVSPATTPGVSKINSFRCASSKQAIVTVLILLALLVFLGDLESFTTPQSVLSAAIELDWHQLMPQSVYTACSVIVIIVPVYYASISDRVGRAEALAVTLVLYFLGLILMGSANKLEQISTGYVFRFLGYAGIIVLPFILVADITSTRFRGLVLSLISILSLISTFIYLPILNGLLNGARRFGFFAYAIIAPFLFLPVILLIVLAQRRSKAQVETRVGGKFVALDAVGLLLLTAAVSFLVVAMNLADTASNRMDSENPWSSATVISLIVIGLLLLPVFILYELRWAKTPFVSRNILGNKMDLVVFAIVFLSQFAASISASYPFMAYYVASTNGSSYADAYVLNIQQVTRYVAAVAAGLVLAFTRKLKWVLVGGLTIQIVGLGITTRTGGAASLAECLAVQIITALGIGSSQLATLVLAQGSVPHTDVASMTALYLLVDRLAYWFGSSIGINIFYKVVLASVQRDLPGESKNALVSYINGWSFTVQRFEPAETMRLAIASAFKAATQRLTIVSTVLALLPLVIALVWIKEVQLDEERQNLVDGELIGEGKQVGKEALV